MQLDLGASVVQHRLNDTPRAADDLVGGARLEHHLPAAAGDGAPAQPLRVAAFCGINASVGGPHPLVTSNSSTVRSSCTKRRACSARRPARAPRPAATARRGVGSASAPLRCCRHALVEHREQVVGRAGVQRAASDPVAVDRSGRGDDVHPWRVISAQTWGWTQCTQVPPNSRPRPRRSRRSNQHRSVRRQGSAMLAPGHPPLDGASGRM